MTEININANVNVNVNDTSVNKEPQKQIIDYITMVTNNDHIITIPKNQICSIIGNVYAYKKSLNKLSKIKEEMKINKISHKHFLQYNYNVNQLKQIAKEHKLKLSGNKDELIVRIYVHLYLSFSAIKIQKCFKRFLQRTHEYKHGPAFKDRSLCTNSIDFLTMDELTNISDEQFFSFKDEDGFIYGFDILSFHNLIFKTKGQVKNPFNTKPLSPDVINIFKSLIRSSKLLKINVTTELVDVTQEVSDKKSVELRSLALFQLIDSLGNYTNPQWFMELNRLQLIKFINELYDIWCYRATLSPEIKQAICYPSGNPFLRLPRHLLHSMEHIDDVRKLILDVIEKIVNTGVDKDSKCLGAYYVLGALTLVSQEAATAMPWLYDAAYHI